MGKSSEMPNYFRENGKSIYDIAGKVYYLMKGLPTRSGAAAHTASPGGKLSLRSERYVAETGAEDQVFAA